MSMFMLALWFGSIGLAYLSLHVIDWLWHPKWLQHKPAIKIIGYEIQGKKVYLKEQHNEPMCLCGHYRCEHQRRLTPTFWEDCTKCECTHFMDNIGDESVMPEQEKESRGFLSIFTGKRSDVGKLLLEKAQSNFQEQQVNQAAGEVQRLMNGIQLMEDEIARNKRNIEIYTDRLEAINQGKFRMERGGYDQFGHMQPLKIVYDDKELNESV